MKYNTRIAPSPTGSFHIGTARTAYFCWLAARATSGRFILRIDDTDEDRSKEEYVKLIYDCMDWLGLDYDIIFRQSSRTHRYKEVANQLTTEGKAKLIDGALMLQNCKAPASWTDSLTGIITTSDEDQSYCKNLVLIRSNGLPTYHFANVVDDIDHNINFVIRGQDHVSNTSRQLAIYDALNKPWPKYAHVGLIHKDKKKLSKRDGASSMLYYKDKNYDPDGMLNFLLRMGWGPSVDDKTTAIIDKKAALRLFLGGGKMRATSAGFDQNKLDSFDRKYKARK